MRVDPRPACPHVRQSTDRFGREDAFQNLRVFLEQNQPAPDRSAIRRLQAALDGNKVDFHAKGNLCSVKASATHARDG